MNKIVECAPNFSEGQRQEVVQAIVDAMIAVPQVHLLDVQMDADHNRSVVTLAGPPESIGQAAIRGVEAAIPRINLTAHRGGHPRIGAADVIPFIPVSGVTLEACVEIARNVGREIAEKFRIPVYLYEAAATRPERVHLENIRKGQFEVLRDEIETKPERKPDFGDAHVHPTAGATVVGARKPLIAFNVNLNTSDVSIAKDIARRIRFSSGGLPCVKAIGLLLKERNQVQVSMNLTDYEHTSLEVAFDAVQREAAAHGTSVAFSEIVGLIPQNALNQVAAAHLHVDNFRSSVILENRLAEVISESSSAANSALHLFIERVASPTPAPGGGSVAALAGVLGVALGQMAIGITRVKKNYQQHQARYEDALARLTRIRTALLGLVDADAAAYGKVMEAYRIPKTTPDRDDLIQKALVGATEVPAETASAAMESLQVVKDLEGVLHPNVATDLQVGLQMLRTAIDGAVANVRVNLQDIKDPEIQRHYEERIRTITNSDTVPGR